METDKEATVEKIQTKKDEIRDLEIEVEWMEKELQRKRDLIKFKKVLIGMYEDQLEEEERVEERKRLNDDDEYFEREREYQRWREWDRSIENDPTYRSVFED